MPAYQSARGRLTEIQPAPTTIEPKSYYSPARSTDVEVGMIAVSDALSPFAM
jgi:hypothetical protein